MADSAASQPSDKTQPLVWAMPECKQAQTWPLSWADKAKPNLVVFLANKVQ